MDDVFEPVQILIMGAENSGKSTALKQFLHIPQEDDNELQRLTQQNVLENVQELKEKLGWNDLDLSPLSQPAAEEGNAEKVHELSKQLQQLFKDPRFEQMALQNGAGTALDSANFWSHRLDRIFDDGTSSPASASFSVQERIRTKSLSNTTFTEYHANHGISFVDVPASWRHRNLNELIETHFPHTTGVVYMVDMERFDEDGFASEMACMEALMNSLPKDRLTSIAFVTVMNKWDVFERKIKCGKVPFQTESRFTDYSHGPEDMDEIKRYLKRKFRKLFPRSKFSKGERKYSTCYQYTSNSVDLKWGNRVFSAVRATLLCKNLADCGFI